MSKLSDDLKCIIEPGNSNFFAALVDGWMDYGILAEGQALEPKRVIQRCHDINGGWEGVWMKEWVPWLNNDHENRNGWIKRIIK